jgi:hypothetical protein
VLARCIAQRHAALVQSGLNPAHTHTHTHTRVLATIEVTHGCYGVDIRRENSRIETDGHTDRWQCGGTMKLIPEDNAIRRRDRQLRAVHTNHVAPRKADVGVEGNQHKRRQNDEHRDVTLAAKGAPGRVRLRKCCRTSVCRREGEQLVQSTGMRGSWPGNQSACNTHRKQNHLPGGEWEKKMLLLRRGSDGGGQCFHG